MATATKSNGLQKVLSALPEKVATLLAKVAETNEQKAYAALMAATALYAIKVAPKVKESRNRENQAGKVQKLPSASRIQDHPLFTWLLGNGMVLGPMALRRWLVPPLAVTDSNLTIFTKAWLGSIITVDLQMALSYFLINKLYAHTPFFSEKRPKQTYWDILTDYLTCNSVLNFFASGLITYMFRNGKANSAEGSGPAEAYRPFRFLFRYAFLRLWVDAAFWAGHWVLHTKKVYWVHKRHHEHNNTTLTTNYHFHWMDLAIEAYIPVLSGILSYEAFFGPIKEVEMNTLSSYMLFHEIMSHAGKAMPCMNIIAPLAPWFQQVDDRNAWAHEMHHNRLKTNYSISYYFDYLMGTSRWE